MERKTESLGFMGWLGLIILLGFLIFKWIPDWTWRAKTPEITINDYFFEAHPSWNGDTATITGETAPSVRISIEPEDAVDQRAHLTVTVNSQKIEPNCSYSERKFCYRFDHTTPHNDGKYEIIAKNDAGEKRVMLNLVIKPKSTESQSTNTQSTNPQSVDSENTSAEPTSPEQTSSKPASTLPSAKSTSCYHYEAGRCWDDLESEIYSNGYYDRENDAYGRSYDYPDDCNSICQDILEDAYEEGYYDY